MTIDQTPSQVTTEYNQRFGGIARLYGIEGLKNLMRARVLVVGLGGVGSWAAESLARSGVGYITLVDLDDICITNTNRQLPAMSGQYGKLKIHVMRDRIHAINPDCHVNAIEDFFTESTSDSILEAPYDYVIDAIDSLKNKALLISKCQQKNTPILITGGAAGKIDPTQIHIDDLGMSSNDALLFRLRKLLRRDFDFAPGFKSGSKRKKFNIMCVYSPEEAIYPTAEGGTCNIPDPESNLKLDCESGMGSVSHITALFGLMAAGHVVNTVSGVQSKKNLQ